MKTIEKDFFLQLKQTNSLRKGDKVLVCVSGGPDSVALLHLLARTSSAFSFTFGIAHVNYSLRGEQSKNEAIYVLSLSQQLQCPFHSLLVREEDWIKEKGSGLEEKARNIRMTFFGKLCEEHGYTKIAIGHHADDLAETILFNLIRGTSPDALSDLMPSQSSYRNLIRPVLSFTKESLIQFLDQKKILYYTDHTNQESEFSRNKIRNQILPLLREINPKVCLSLLRFKEILKTETDYMQSLVHEFLASSAVSAEENKILLNREKFIQLPASLQARVIREIRFKLTKNRCDFYYFQIKTIVLGIIGNKKFNYKDKQMLLYSRGDWIVLEKDKV